MDANKAIAQIFKAEPKAHLLKIEPGKKSPLKGTRWRSRPLTEAEALGWVSEGGRLGIVPASVRCGVLDLDTGGQPIFDAVKTLLGDPIDFIPSASAVEGGEPRGHLIYPTETPTGNGKWIGGDFRVENGYVLIKDADGLSRWANAVGISVYRQPPSIDLTQARTLTASAKRNGSAVFAAPFDPAEHRIEDGYIADSSEDPIFVPTEPITGLRKAVLRSIRRAARDASDAADLEARGRRLIAWFGECRKVQASAKWNLTEEMRRFDEDRAIFAADVAKHSVERFGAFEPEPNEDDPAGALIAHLTLTNANSFADFNKAIQACVDARCRWMHADYRDETFVDALLAEGYGLRKNDLTGYLQIRIGEDWTDLEGGDDGTAPLRQAKNEISNRTLVIERSDKKSGGGSFTLRRIPANAWGRNGPALYGAVTGLIGSVKVPNENPRTAFIDAELEAIEALTETERQSLVDGLSDAFTAIPGMKPKGKASAELAKHAGRSIYTNLGHRLLQTHPKYRSRAIRVQRECVVFVGAPGIGKSTFMRNLAPTSIPAPTGAHSVEIDLTDALNVTLRRIASVGALLANIDDMDALNTGRTKIGQVKSLMTKSMITYDPKYLGDRTIPNPCVFIGSANRFTPPDDEGATLRFVPIVLEADRKAGQTAEESALAMLGYLTANVHLWTRAGLIRAIANAQVELSDLQRQYQLTAIGDASADDEGVLDCVREMVKSGRFEDADGLPAIAVWQVAHRLGWLVRPHPPALGEAIPPPTEGDPADLQLLRDAWSREAKSIGARRQAGLIRSAFRSVGWVRHPKAKVKFAVKVESVWVHGSSVFVPDGLHS